VKKRILMGKRELVKTLHERQDSMSREEIGELIDSALTLIVDTVAKGGEVGLVGFGKFRPVARNLQRGPDSGGGAGGSRLHGGQGFPGGRGEKSLRPFQGDALKWLGRLFR